jgi:transposase-like protein
MDPHTRFCHKKLLGLQKQGEGHVAIPSKKERRYRCKRYNRSYSESKGMPLYRAHKPRRLLV